jgi:hypothetical protein
VPSHPSPCMMSRFAIVVAVWLALVVAPASAAPVTQPGNRALIVAIGDYPPDSGVSVLGGPAEDARLMRGLAIDTLGYAPGEVRLLIDSQATRQGILDAIDDWLIAGSRSGDRVLFHFSGHGYQVPDLDGDESDGLDEVLIPYDVRTDERRELQNVILDDEISQRLARLTDRSVMVVIDSCNSGTISRSVPENALQAVTRAPWSTARAEPRSGTLRGAQVEPLRREEASFVDVTAASRMAIWTAVSSVQWALDDEDAAPRSGLFTNRLVRALTSSTADANRDGVLTHAELLDWLRGQSTDYCRLRPHRCPFSLTPTLEVSENLMLQSVAVVTRGEPLMQVAAGDLALQAVSGSQGTSGLRLDVLANGQRAQTIYIGDVNQFQVRSEHAGYLSLFSVDPLPETGEPAKVVHLFPSARSIRLGADGRIGAGATLTIPGDDYGVEFVAGGPVGRQRVIALVTQDRIDFSRIQPPARGVEVEAADATVLTAQGSQDYLVQLAALLRQPWNLDGEQREARWSAVIADILVRPEAERP